MKKCKFYSECKNQQLLWDLHAGITRDAKSSCYMGTICEYCKERLKNPVAIMGPICGYCNEWRLLAILCDLYAGIERNAKCQWLLWDFYGGIAMNAKCLWLFLDLYAGIAFLKMALWSS